MRTHLIRGRRRVWRAACAGLGGSAVLLGIGAFGVLGASPAQAMGNGSQLVPVFVVQPATTQVDTAVTPAVVVKVENSNGQVDWNYDGQVTLKFAVNPVQAPSPTGNVAYADKGIATFPDLTFSSVGFGFELEAVISGQPAKPWLPGWEWEPGYGHETGWGDGTGWGGGTSYGGGVSAPSAPFDIVGQLLQCEAEQTCHSETVSSDGTSGSSAANTAEGSGQLAATGGGFGPLSCTSVGGVVSFSSNLPQTITVTLAGYLADHHWLWSFNICWGSAEPFTTKFGSESVFNPANDEYEGLLPNCRPYQPAPCVLSRSRTWWGPVVITVLAPAGDPHMTY